uniref:Ig-like domain-containing protein n=1 Tax=Chrysemys picta bellii TaxID=8478 RepID=A0A8C3I5U4_CHRPI
FVLNLLLINFIWGLLQSGFTLAVPQLVSVQEGLCVLIPCTFTYPASYDTYNSWAQLFRYWYKDPAIVDSEPPVASTDSSRRVSQETQGRFRLAGDLLSGDCSLQISDAQQTDAGRYFFRFEKGTLKYNYRSNSDGLARLGAEGDIVSLETQEGDSLNLSCEAGSRPEATLSWARTNRSLIPGQGGDWHLELPNLSRGDAGEYRCWAKNSYGSASRALRVHVQSKALGGSVPPGSGQGFSAGVQGAGLGLSRGHWGAGGGQDPWRLLGCRVCTPATHRTKDVQDGAATAQAPLGPREPDELQYASISFSKLQRWVSPARPVEGRGSQ